MLAPVGRRNSRGLAAWMSRSLACKSQCIAGAVLGQGQQGVVHSPKAEVLLCLGRIASWSASELRAGIRSRAIRVIIVVVTRGSTMAAAGILSQGMQQDVRQQLSREKHRRYTSIIDARADCSSLPHIRGSQLSPCRLQKHYIIAGIAPLLLKGVEMLDRLSPAGVTCRRNQEAHSEAWLLSQLRRGASHLRRL